MEITSYLLGKKAGGGSGANLQEKSVSITTNGTTNVVPDENYDGMTKVAVTTNIQPQLESKSITITTNGTTTISPSQGKDGLSSVEVITSVGGSGIELFPPVDELDYYKYHYVIYHYHSEPNGSYTGEDNYYLVFFNNQNAIGWPKYSDGYYRSSFVCVPAPPYSLKNQSYSVYKLNNGAWQLVKSSPEFYYNPPGGDYHAKVTVYITTLDVCEYSYDIGTSSIDFTNPTYPVGYIAPSKIFQTYDMSSWIDVSKFTLPSGITTSDYDIFITQRSGNSGYRMVAFPKTTTNVVPANSQLGKFPQCYSFEFKMSNGNNVWYDYYDETTPFSKVFNNTATDRSSGISSLSKVIYSDRNIGYDATQWWFDLALVPLTKPIDNE